MNEQVLQRLDALAAKLGVTATHLWEVLVRQAWVDGVTAVAFFVLSAVVFGVWYRALRKRMEEVELEYKWESRLGEALVGDGPQMLIGGFLSGLAAIIATINLLCIVPTALLNPEYYALKQVLDVLR